MKEIALDGSGIRIDGEPRTLLCASLFYFRLPREQWRARLEQVRDSGYTCVDVYLPWNFHEPTPGEWTFEGRRDVAAFLDLAHETGLYVIARPGPYICSEWDGGALPAWLGLEPELRVRQNEPRYLAEVAKWFDRVLPLIAERQYPAGGPVVMVQLENELDFFDCADRTGYLTALRDMATAHGITVPLVACAGQGDIAGATGDVPGVVPACNFYPDDDSPYIEEEARHYADVLGARDLPLLVTETNRRHRTLRRLLASGASLIAPYLQSSGWNFGYTPSTGNWGEPGNFMSHGYDFGGYVSSTGAARPEHAEARLLARVVEAYGERLAGARAAASPAMITCDFPTSSVHGVLALEGGGHLVAVPHLGTDRPGRAVVDGVEVAVAADSCPLMAVDVPVGSTVVNLASADLVEATDHTLVFASAVPVTVIVDGTRVDLPAPAEGRATHAVVGGLTLSAVAPEKVATAPDVPRREAVRTVRRREETAPERRAGRHSHPPTLESLGAYRGRGTYRSTSDLDLTDADALLLTGAADIVDLTIAGRVRPTIAGFGAAERIDVRDVTGTAAVEATVEIWGHANFDDARLPALGLGAPRGLGTLWTIRATRDVSALWRVTDHWAGEPTPLRVLGGWSSTRVGVPLTYARDVSLPGQGALHLQGLTTPVRVALDGDAPRTVHAENPWLLLPEGTHTVAVTLPHDPSGARPTAELLTLEPVTDWTCTVQDDAQLAEFAARRTATHPLDLPLTLRPGEEAWLEVDLPPGDSGRLLRVDGDHIRVTGWADDADGSAPECIGRIWVGGDRPAFSGGDPDALWLPSGWSNPRLLIRGLAGKEEAELRRLWLEHLDD
ncbi:beta-galactosidase [Streptomyces sp. VRA16 Mangrove soil]|uniref:beta-galactosidase n=1 Tax=Streptomyces sp. VRA16 Mangrove soil TaxID=2817434 RepID=UPI0027DEA2AC|nr:beta-galactosidase [Streptomyces sp. VRA16 Mangrove soil]